MFRSILQRIRDKSFGFRVGLIRKILHDPKYIILGEIWYDSIVASCSIFSLNNTTLPKLTWNLAGTPSS